MKHIILLILSLVILKKVVRSQYAAFGSSSSCPEFESNGRQTFALIEVPPQRGSTIIHISVLVGVEGSYYGGSPDLYLEESQEEAIQALSNGNSIEYICSFPGVVQYARILRIVINGRPTCYGRPLSGRNGFTATVQRSFSFHSNDWINPTSNFGYPYDVNFPLNINQQRPSPRINPPSRGPSHDEYVRPALTPSRTTPSTTTPSTTTISTGNGICGKMARNQITKKLVISGTEVDPGEFPWIVAIYVNAFNFNNYICGGTLISNKYALTAAHCTQKKEPYYLDFGRHNISNESEEKGHTRRISLHVFNHENYVGEPGKLPQNDIAVIFFEPIEFTDQITPICLWLQKTPVSTIFHGKVAGWGQVENGNADKSEVPLQVPLISTSADDCKSEFPDINPDQVFCARGEMAGPCKGDSGSGFYVEQKDTWYIRGIVSASKGEFRSCNVETHAVYTDISSYVKWLQKFL